jgi:threonine/homoserine/homoserine lactone efflux protein
MPDYVHILTFGLVALGMVLTPGPNMIYLISRSICQGKRAGLISWAALRLALSSTCFVPHSA